LNGVMHTASHARTGWRVAVGCTAAAFVAGALCGGLRPISPEALVVAVVPLTAGLVSAAAGTVLATNASVVAHLLFGAALAGLPTCVVLVLNGFRLGWDVVAIGRQAPGDLLFMFYVVFEYAGFVNVGAVGIGIGLDAVAVLLGRQQRFTFEAYRRRLVIGVSLVVLAACLEGLAIGVRHRA
jgi:hypothetical protein